MTLSLNLSEPKYLVNAITISTPTNTHMHLRTGIFYFYIQTTELKDVQHKLIPKNPYFYFYPF